MLSEWNSFICRGLPVLLGSRAGNKGGAGLLWGQLYVVYMFLSICFFPKIFIYLLRLCWALVSALRIFTVALSVWDLVPCACVLRCFRHVWPSATLRTVALQAPLSMGFSRQEYWSWLPFHPPGDLPGLGMEPASPAPPELQEESLPPSRQGGPLVPALGAQNLSHWTTTEVPCLYIF